MSRNLGNLEEVLPTERVWHIPPIPFSAKVRERVELYLYSTSGPSRPMRGRNLPFILPVNRSSFAILENC
jgi:hypothetical protein